MADSTITVHLVIEGMVQGVGYRDAMCREARRLHLTGWVRNCGDGTVEATVQGKPGAVQELLEWAHRGPPAARVGRVQASPVPPEQGKIYRSFEWLRTV